MIPQLEFTEVDANFHKSECGAGTYVVLRSGGIWYWYLVRGVRGTNAAKVDSFASAVEACQKHFEENSNAG